MTLEAEKEYVKACAAATESEKPLCKYGPSCHRMSCAELRAHHAHKYKHPAAALKVFVLGPPQCGKTQLCSQLESKCHTHTSLPLLKSESWQLSKIFLRFPHLIHQMFDATEVFAANIAVPSTPRTISSGVSEDLTKCVVACLSSSEQKDCGWILENFPRSVSQLKIMAEAGVLPHCVVNIEDSSVEDPIAQDLICNERQELLAELRRFGIFIINVKSPDILEMAANGTGLSDDSRKKDSLLEQTWPQIQSYLHSAAIPPYKFAFPLQTEKRFDP
jgi:adenylate kinase family enzyme